MIDYKSLLHVLNKDNEIILVDPLENNKEFLVFLNLLEEEEYFKFPIQQEGKKYITISKKTDFFNLYEKLLSMEKNEFQGKLLTIIIQLLTYRVECFDRYYNKMIKKMKESYKDSSGRVGKDVATRYLRIIRNIATTISRKIDENNLIDLVDSGGKKVYKNKLDYSIKDLSVLVNFLIDYKSDLDYSYWGATVDFQSLVSYVIFNDYDNSQDILTKVFTRKLSEYRTSEILPNYILSLNDVQLEEFAMNHKKYKSTSSPLLLLEILNRKIYNYDKALEITGTDRSIRDIFSYFKADGKGRVDPLQYKDELLEIAFHNADHSNWITDLKSKIQVSTRNLYSINPELLRSYYTRYESEIKDAYKQYKLPFEIIILNNYFENNIPGYSEILFYNDENIMRTSEIGSREWNFALMMNTLFRMDSESRKLVSNKTIHNIIDKGVESFIGSSDTYSLRNRLARIMASFIHEKEMTRNKKYDIPRKEDIRYLIEAFSKSKLRATFFAKIFNMPKELESNKYEIRNYMEKRLFFKRSYAEFVNMIDDIDHSEELDSVILLLALS